MNEFTKFIQSFVSFGIDLLVDAPAFVNHRIAIVLVISGFLVASWPFIIEALTGYSYLLPPTIVVIAYLAGLYLTICVLIMLGDFVIALALVMASGARLYEGLLWGSTAFTKRLYFLMIPAGIVLGLTSHFILMRFAPEYQRFALLLWNIYVAVSSTLFLKWLPNHPLMKDNPLIKDKESFIYGDSIMSLGFVGYTTVFIGVQFYIPSTPWLRITYLALFPVGFVFGTVLTLIDIFYKKN